MWVVGFYKYKLNMVCKSNQIYVPPRMIDTYIFFVLGRCLHHSHREIMHCSHVTRFSLNTNKNQGRCQIPELGSLKHTVCCYLSRSWPAKARGQRANNPLVLVLEHCSSLNSPADRVNYSESSPSSQLICFLCRILLTYVIRVRLVQPCWCSSSCHPRQGLSNSALIGS
jgi:hypothetical protein